MSKFPPMRVPLRLHEYIKEKAKQNETSTRIEVSKMFDEYREMKAQFEKIKPGRWYKLN